MAVSNRFATSLTEEGRYRLLVEGIADYAIYMLDRAGFITSWNLGAKRIKGYDAAEILGKHFSIFYNQDDQRNGLPDRALEAAARSGSFEGEGWRLRKDGSRFWAHVVIDPIRDEAGELAGFAKITRDLTERQAARDALRRSEEQFRHLVQSVTDYAIYQLDTAGMIVSWNAGAARIKGYRPDEAIGSHFSMFFTAADQEKAEPARALEAAARNGRFETEAWRVRKNGDVFLANVVITPMLDDNGAVVGFAKVTRDMTAARQVQLDLDRAREGLLLAQRMEAVGQLTGGIAHDFNIIFRTILDCLGTAKRSLPEDPDFTPHVDRAVQLAHKGRSLTHRMMALSERQEFMPERVEVPVLLNGIAGLLQRTLGPSFVIELRFPSSMGAVYADPNQFTLVIVNLLRNARDAMPDGGTIIVAGREDVVASRQGAGTNSHPYVCLSVTDCGDGMDEATLARATEPFFTTKGVGKGSGLGLSMAQSFAAQSGGQFVIRSERGSGTVAELWLPLMPDARGSFETGPPAKADQISQPTGNKRHLVVLAVDDDRLGLMSTAAMLTKLGHRVYTALSGNQALDMIRQQGGIDVVIIDHALPDMTGASLAEAIKADRPNMPIIFATPLADASVLQVSKPLRADELSMAVARIAPANIRTAN